MLSTTVSFTPPGRIFNSRVDFLALAKNRREQGHSYIHAELSLSEVRSTRVAVEQWAEKGTQKIINRMYKRIITVIIIA